MNERFLSEKLDELASRLEVVAMYFPGYDDNHEEVQNIAKELHKLSKETYAPGNSVSWTDVKPKTMKKTYTDKTGRKLPF